MLKDATEYEAKLLNISVDNIVEKLTKIGAKKESSCLFRRYVLDTIPASTNRWVRLRSDGLKTTLTVKEIHNNNIDGTDEWEVEVSDIDTCLTILEKIGIRPRGYQENTRILYTLGRTEIAIDQWPGLEPYIEIEGPSKQDVVITAQKLGYSENELDARNTEHLYADIGIDIKNIKELKFDEDITHLAKS